MAFVCKQTAVLVVRINNIGHVLADFWAFFSVGLTSCISIVFLV